MTEPLRISFDVACSVEHAFAVWTSGIGSWWPRDHTVSGQADVVVVLQSGVGRRIYERTADGAEHDWGEVTVWNPPGGLAYLWHLGRVTLSTVAGSDLELRRARAATAITPVGKLCCRTFLKRPRKDKIDDGWYQGRSVGAQDRARHLRIHHAQG